ncbi:MAG: oligosaccharide flippase family protein [Bacteroidaceae bacterium]|nr:oligosaccharide flippase family protein [Bacteroidaceae bacterium]
MSEQSNIDPQTTSVQDDSTYDHIVKQTGIFGGVQGVTILMNLIRNKIASVLLGPDGLALINIFNNATRLISESTNFGISISAVKQMAELYEAGDRVKVCEQALTVRTWSLYLGLLGALTALVLAPWLSLWTFENYDYTTSYMLIAPIVGAGSVIGGEMAILKGLKRLKNVAVISVISATSILIISAPLYFILHIQGIIWALLLCQIAVLVIHLRYSTRAIPWQTALSSRTQFIAGLPMLRLGIGYVLAGLFGQGAEYLIRLLILRWGTQADVGLYYSGYLLTVTYASMVFVAFEADYFPRLSATEGNVERQNQTVNQQIMVSILLMAPLLSLFVMALPILLPLLFSSKFTEAIPMAITATYYMFFKSGLLGAAYLPLARGDSKMYMLTELFYDLIIAVAVPLAFRRWGLVGTGWALSLACLLDMLFIHVVYRFKYQYQVSKSVISIFLVQLLLFSITFASTGFGTLWLRWSVGLPTATLSFVISYRFLKRETTLIDKIKNRFRRNK